MSFAPEDQLLLECARTRLDAAICRRVGELVRRPLDWDYVIETSVRHAIAPLVSHALHQVGAREDIGSFVPTAARANLDDLYRRSDTRNRVMLEALAEILDALGAAGVPVMALKDVQLVLDAYPDRALRPMGDLDLLIRKDDYAEAARCLRAVGFERRPPVDMPYTRRYASGQGFWRERDAVWLDLQWGVAQREWDLGEEGRFTYGVDRMWQTARPLSFDGRDLLGPSPDEMLFHLCLHLEGHEYSELILFTDIVELLRHVGAALDWERFRESVRLHSAESSVHYVLLLAQQLFGVALPDRLLHDFAPPYFQGDLFRPVFGNLTNLHLSLDEIRLVASPPQALLDEFELVVRRQAARARRLFVELDDLARAFVEAGSSPIALFGQLPPRLFPDPSIPAFNELHALILRGHEPQFETALRDAGFDIHDGGSYVSKRCTITSTDPILAGESVTLSIHGEEIPALGAALEQEENWTRSNRRAALRSLAARLRPRRIDDDEAHVRLLVHPLPPEDLAVVLLARAGKPEPGRLFRVCAVLAFLRRCPQPLDFGRLTQAAKRSNLEPSVTAAVGIVGAIEALGGQVGLDGLGREGSPARVLEFARYDLSSLEQRPALRDVYYFLLSFLAIDGVQAKARFFLRALFLPRGGLPVLPRLAVRLAAHSINSHRRRRATLADLSYWTRTTPSPESTHEQTWPARAT